MMQLCPPHPHAISLVGRWGELLGPLRGVVPGGMAFDEFVERYVAAAGLAIGETVTLLTLSLHRY